MAGFRNRKEVYGKRTQGHDWSVFFNTKKQGEQPDRCGSITINGIEYELAGWNRESKGSTVFTSLLSSRRSEQVPRAVF